MEKTGNTQCSQGGRITATRTHLLVRMQNGTATSEICLTVCNRVKYMPAL